MAETEPRNAKPGALLSQWWTLGELLRDNRRARSHDAVLWVILDAHRAKTGHCPASVRYIKAKLAGPIVSSDTITKAIEDLEAWGYISRVPRHKRSAPTEFIPKWVCVPADRDTGVPAQQDTGVPANRDESSYSNSPADRPAEIVNGSEVSTPAASGLW